MIGICICVDQHFYCFEPAAPPVLVALLDFGGFDLLDLSGLPLYEAA